jgi:hypothetical protein
MSPRGFLKLLHAYIYLSAQYYRMRQVKRNTYPNASAELRQIDQITEDLDKARYRFYFLAHVASSTRQRAIWDGANNVPYQLYNPEGGM